MGPGGLPLLELDLEAVDVTYVLHHLETTGPDVEQDRIVQMAAKVWVGCVCLTGRLT